MKLQSSLASLMVAAVVFAAASEAKASCPNPLPLSQASATSQINTKRTANSWLGSSISAVINPPEWGCEGWYEVYTNGGIWVSAETSAHVLGDYITTKYLFGGWIGTLGYPISDPLTVPTGEANSFAFGTIYHKTGAAAALVMDTQIFNRWQESNFSGLGEPGGDMSNVSGGHRNNFTHGFMIDDASGPRPVLQGEYSSPGVYAETNCPEFGVTAWRTSGNSLGGQGHLTTVCTGSGRYDFYIHTASGTTFLGYSWGYDNIVEMDTGFLTNFSAGYCSAGKCFVTIEVRDHNLGLIHSVASFQLNP